MMNAMSAVRAAGVVATLITLCGCPPGMGGGPPVVDPCTVRLNPAPTGLLAWRWKATSDGWGPYWDYWRPYTRSATGGSAIHPDYLDGRLVPDQTTGIAFAIGMRHYNKVGVFYAMEFTIERPPGCAHELEITYVAVPMLVLPRGVCMGDNYQNCIAGEQGVGSFELHMIEDPGGIMAVSGDGRTRLEEAAMKALKAGPGKTGRTLVFWENSTKREELSDLFAGQLRLPAGGPDVKAHLYVGLFAYVSSVDPGWSGWFGSDFAESVSIRNCFGHSPPTPLYECGHLYLPGVNPGTINVSTRRP